MIEIRWHGRGGQGAFTAARLLGAAVVLNHQHALAFPSFGPERRGAPVTAFTKIDSKKITDRTMITSCDYIIVLDETLYKDSMKEQLKTDGKLILNTKKQSDDERVICFDGTKLAYDVLQSSVCNVVMLGVFIQYFKPELLPFVFQLLPKFFTEKTASKNEQLLQAMVKRIGGVQ